MILVIHHNHSSVQQRLLADIMQYCNDRYLQEFQWIEWLCTLANKESNSHLKRNISQQLHGLNLSKLALMYVLGFALHQHRYVIAIF